MPRLLLLFIFLFIYLSGIGQLLPMKVYTTREGLNSNAIQSILQDNRGLLWIGTNDGINWYDGSHIISPPMKSKNGQIFVNHLYEDRQHNIWVSSFYSGLYKFDGEKFTNYLIDTVKPESTVNNVFRVQQIDDSHYLIATDNNLYIFDGTHFTIFDPANKLLGGQVNVIAINKNNDVLIVKDTGVIWYHPGTTGWNFQGRLLSGSKVNDILFTDDSCWIATSKGLLNFRQSDFFSAAKSPIKYLAGKSVNKLSLDRNRCIWATSERVYKISGSHVQAYGTENGLPSSDVNNVFVDAESNTWFATTEGLAKMNDEFYRFYDFSVFSRENKIKDESEPKDSFIKMYSLLERPSISYVFFILRTREGTIWAGTSAGLFKISSKGLIKINDVIARSGYEDDSGNIWLALQNNSLSRYSGNKFYGLRFNNEVPDLPETIFRDNHGYIWVGYATMGIKKFSISGDSLILLKEYNSSNGYPNLRIRCFLDDRKGHLIFGTRTNGIIILPVEESTNGKPLTINKTNGLNASWIKQMVLDDSGNILMASNNGLFYLKSGDYQHPQIQITPFLNERVPTELNTIYKGQRGYWIFTASGLIQFFPDQEKFNTMAPKVYLTRVHIDGREDPAFLPYSKQVNALRLPYQSENISFDFTSTSFKIETAVRYKFILEGADHHWSEPSELNSINYIHLKPGSYTFKVTASNNNGVWSETPATFSFVIALPFWQSWWFISLTAVFIIFIIYSIYRYRIRQFMQLEKLRTQISTDLHDDIGSTLSSISILSDMALRQKKSQTADDMMFEIKQNSVSLMERIDDIVWSINPKNDTIENLLLRVKNLAAQLFEARNIDYSILIDEGIKEVKLSMSFRQHIYLIMKEAINNLVKYSHCTAAKIVAQYSSGILTVLIEDNGVGFDTNSESRGNGLINIRRRTNIIHGNILIKSCSGNTSITLSVKIK